MIADTLYQLNHARVWHRNVSVCGRRIRAASLDRLIYLGLHKFGLMGVQDLQLLKQLITPGMQILDIGANIGLYSLVMARLTGGSGHVYSFEPEPNLFSFLKQNCAANSEGNISLFQLALGNTNGKATFHRSLFNSGDNRLRSRSVGAERLEVDVARLDDIQDVRKIDFVKMDVQGHELGVLQGMEGLLESNPRVRLLFEFWPMGLRQSYVEPYRVLSFLTERGFNLYALQQSKLRHLQDPAQVMARLSGSGYTNLVACREPVEVNASY
jgi:FkbM family methyltransferase